MPSDGEGLDGESARASLTGATRALLVAGPHRSGTSALTRVLNLLGVELGSEMLAARHDNRLGYWEHRAVFDLHERLLPRLDSYWHDYRALPSGWFRRQELSDLREEIRQLVRGELARSELWAIKDPRLSRLLPLWLDLLDEESIESSVVVVVRNPLDVVRSLRERDGFSAHKAYFVYLAAVLDAISDSSERRRVFVSYERLLEDWRGVARDIGAGLDLEWPSGSSRAAEVDAFLRPSERHQRSSRRELEEADFLPVWGVELYEALEEATRGRVDRLLEVHARARSAFDPARGLLGPEIGRLEQFEAAASAERGRLERRAKRLETDLDKVQEHLSSVLSSPLYRHSRRLRSLLGRVTSWLGRFSRAVER